MNTNGCDGIAEDGPIEIQVCGVLRGYNSDWTVSPTYSRECVSSLFSTKGAGCAGWEIKVLLKTVISSKSAFYNYLCSI